MMMPSVDDLAMLDWWITISVSILTTYVVYFFRSLWSTTTDDHTKQMIPRGPFSFPIVGNVPQLVQAGEKRLEYFEHLTREYGEEAWRLNVGAKTYICTNSPLNVEHILKKNFKNYIKGSDMKSKLQDFLGNGIFNVDGDQWKQQRKVASHMFNVRTLRDTMTHVFVDHGLRLLQQVAKTCSTEKKYIDIQDWFARYTLDSICKIAFGYPINSLALKDAAFAKAFDRVNVTVSNRFRNPFWRIFRWIWPSEFQMRKDMAVLSEIALSTIRMKRRRAQLMRDVPDQEDDDAPTDLLGRFMELKDQDGQAFDDEYLCDMVLNFILAGRDTTANALTWCVYLLATNLTIQDRARAEVGRITRDSMKDQLTYEHLKDMDYLQAIVNETLRLYPSVPFDSKEAVEDDILPTGHVVKAKQFVAYLPWTMGRSDKIWTDPMTFRPERWLESKKPTAFEYPTFQAGPRLCLGQHMAYLEIKSMLALLLQTYRIRLQPHQTILPVHGLTLPVKDGLFVCLEPL